VTSTRVLRSADRFVTPTAWGRSLHCFSFGEHYDPDNVGFGLLVSCNEEELPPGAGFDEHEHHDVEIVTWVLDGLLDHEDSSGNGGVARAGVVRRMTAGRGITHSERNDATASGPVRFVQSWLAPAEAGGAPSFEQRDVSGRLATGGLVAVASGRGHDGAVRLGQTGAVLHVAVLRAGESVALPKAPFVHVLIGRGSVELDGAGLDQGDSARITDAEAVSMTATAPAEVLVWEMHPPTSPR
jgi:redox-sensitive bicupin YhaK (pirin superfamily)